MTSHAEAVPHPDEVPAQFLTMPRPRKGAKTKQVIISIFDVFLANRYATGVQCKLSCLFLFFLSIQQLFSL